MTPILLAGPTASGKSALAMRIAERDGGCVINADAMQVYSCWRVLTARPSAADMRRVPHALYGHVECARRYSVGDWLRDLAPVLDDLGARGVRPVITGGTGLYFTALTEGLAAIPPVPPAIRAASQALLESGRSDTMLTDLARDDPETFARIDRANPMRVQRAWCVLKATGRGLTDWQSETATAGLSRWDGYIIDVDISLLNNNISLRFDKLIEDGALDECRAFLAAGYAPDLPSARVLGAPDLIRHLRRETDLSTAAGTSIIATRQYAKRQRSWFRNRMPGWTRLNPADGDPLDSIAAGTR
jgi:tRNA dimethylallyltransferase